MSRKAAPLAPGLYEQVVDRRLAKLLESMAEGGSRVGEGSLDRAEAPRVLSAHLQRAVAKVLRGLDLKQQVDLVSKLLRCASEEAPRVLLSEEAELLDSLLLSIQEPAPLAAKGVEGPLTRPGIPLAESALLVNANHEWRIGAELKREILSADRIDLLCSFLKVSGLNTLRGELTRFFARGGEMRVLTTTYIGATQRKAVDDLAGLGAEVRISYDTQRAPLHAKAWIFHRRSGFSTGYIGSSNLSRRALGDGREWNVRASNVDMGGVLRTATGTFESYWASPDFKPYGASKEECAELEQALEQARGGAQGGLAARDGDERLTFFDLRPYAFQAEVLEKLALEREDHGRHRNLVVAATGTGKTMIAAFDYERLARGGGRRPSLLFVAHRGSIIRQSRGVFRQVLRDGGFGELLVGEERPKEGRQVFATVQSLNNVDLATLPPDTFDVVIVDEFHHAAAATYDRLLAHFQPRELLGLTATPERADGKDVLDHFDGRIAHEIRLWDAIGRSLLCPFQYFGIRDRVDLDHLAARGGRYRTSDLDGVYTGDDARVMLILRAMAERLADPRMIRGLGFCVSVAHARFMAESFTRRGLPAVAVTAKSSLDERRKALAQLKRREINLIFAVDLYNEGVDIPYLDTLLLLRPTESAPLFLQQLGRGLRKHPEKEHLMVFDFIGLQHRTFRFDRYLGALADVSRRELIRVVSEGFPLLPSGCSVTLDAEAQEVVLESLKRSAVPNLSQLGREVRELAATLDGPPTLTQALAALEVEPEQIYSGGRCYSELLLKAELLEREAPIDKDAAKALGRLLHIDDLPRLDRLRRSVEAQSVGSPARDGLDSAELVTSALLAGREGPSKAPSILAMLSQDSDLSREFEQLAEHLGAGVLRAPRSEAALPEGCPLALHCRYSMSEIMAALGETTKGGSQLKRAFKGSMISGDFVLIFITLRKSDKLYSPSTMYEDYAIDRSHIHWQSPNNMSPTTAAGRVHIGDGSAATPLIFIREAPEERGRPRPPYYFLGAATCIDHQGERPISITWELKSEMPAALFERFRLCRD